MVKQLGDRMAVVTLQELGTNCWLARRFIEEGSRCDRIYTCSYPEKGKCQAVRGEIKHIMGEQARLITVYKSLHQRILELRNMLEK